MPTYQYVILSSAVSGKEHEFYQWYDEQHLQDVMQVPGVIAARRYNVLSQKTTGITDVNWHAVAIYEIESDNPQAVVEAIAKAANTLSMPVTDAMAKQGLTQLLVEKSAELSAFQ